MDTNWNWWPLRNQCHSAPRNYFDSESLPGCGVVVFQGHYPCLTLLQRHRVHMVTLRAEGPYSLLSRAQGIFVPSLLPNANISPPGWHQLFILDGPTPSHSQRVRIGGDPARLGEWPNYPDFTFSGLYHFAEAEMTVGPYFTISSVITRTVSA
jgi:hypothetical protein